MADRGRASDKSDKKSEGLIPTPEGIDPNWKTKVAIAKKVREKAIEARRGKRMAFKTHLFG